MSKKIPESCKGNENIGTRRATEDRGYNRIASLSRDQDTSVSSQLQRPLCERLDTRPIATLLSLCHLSAVLMSLLVRKGPCRCAILSQVREPHEDGRGAGDTGQRAGEHPDRPDRADHHFDQLTAG